MRLISSRATSSRVCSILKVVLNQVLDMSSLRSSTACSISRVRDIQESSMCLSHTRVSMRAIALSWTKEIRSTSGMDQSVTCSRDRRLARSSKPSGRTTERPRHKSYSCKMEIQQLHQPFGMLLVVSPPRSSHPSTMTLLRAPRTNACAIPCSISVTLLEAS